jgi:hypothetical protein
MGLQNSEENWVAPGTIRLTSSAWKFAWEFDQAVRGTQKGRWVIAISWCHSVSVKRGPNEPYEEIGSCLSLGAFNRQEIPPQFIQVTNGLEYVLQIPEHVWRSSAHRVIDVDEALLFKLTLR